MPLRAVADPQPLGAYPAVLCALGPFHATTLDVLIIPEIIAAVYGLTAIGCTLACYVCPTIE